MTSGHLLFSNYQRHSLPTPTSDAEQQSLFQELGRQWQTLSQKQRDFWNQLARGPDAFLHKQPAYILFSNATRDGLQEDAKRKGLPPLTVPQTGQELGKQWSSLKPSQRDFWTHQEKAMWPRKGLAPEQT